MFASRTLDDCKPLQVTVSILLARHGAPGNVLGARGLPRMSTNRRTEDETSVQDLA